MIYEGGCEHHSWIKAWTWTRGHWSTKLSPLDTTLVFSRIPSSTLASRWNPSFFRFFFLLSPPRFASKPGNSYYFVEFYTNVPETFLSSFVYHPWTDYTSDERVSTNATRLLSLVLKLLRRITEEKLSSSLTLSCFFCCSAVIGKLVFPSRCRI